MRIRAGNIVVFLSVAIGWCGAFAAPADIRISEVHYHPAAEDQSLQFLELVNTGGESVDLAGWTLRDGIAFTFPAHTTINGGEYLVVAKDARVCRQVFADVAIVGDFEGALSDGGERVRLFDASGRFIDEVSWYEDSPWPEAPDGQGPSLEKRQLRNDGAWPDVWASSVTVNGSPGLPNGGAAPAAAGSIVINEIAPAVGFIELLNIGEETVDLSGCHLSLTPRDPRAYTIPVGANLAPGAFFAITAAELGNEIPWTGGVLLTDTAGRGLIDGVDYAVQGVGDGAAARFPDGTGTLRNVSSPTRAMPNAAPRTWGVVINEIMYHPPETADGDESEWIELVNTSAHDVDLSGWRLTRAVQYAFPEGASIAVGAFLVVARNPARCAADYGIENVFGPFAGGLKNDAERIVLRDGADNMVDSVRYADDGAWPFAPDGEGMSLELINPAYDNECGRAWAASKGSATPGARNSVYTTALGPLIRSVRHDPAVPDSTTPVAITCAVDFPASPPWSVEVAWRIDGGAETRFTHLHDDGAHSDGRAGDGIWGALLDPLPEGTIVCFFVAATDEAGRTAIMPAEHPVQPSRWLLYQVQRTPPGGEGLTYRIIMTAASYRELMTRDVWSNVPLPATCIAGNEIFYDATVRFRGRASRILPVKSLRVRLSDDHDFLNMQRINLNGYSPERQQLGMALFQAADVPAPLTRLVRVIVNNVEYADYIQPEAVDGAFVERRYRGDEDGNLYRCVLLADLAYRGPDKEAYRPHYLKRSQEDRDDFSDIIALCDAFTNTPDDRLVAVLEPLVDLDEWLRFLAVHTLLNEYDGVYRGLPDDYFLYRRPSDSKFVIIPWDTSWSFTNATEPILRPAIASFERLVAHPLLGPRYYATLEELLAGHFSAGDLEGRIIDAAGSDTARANEFRDYAAARRELVLAQSRVGLEARLASSLRVERSATWRYASGQKEPSAEPLAWTRPEFDDSAWEQGRAAFGYGYEGADTPLADMRGAYTTLYLRHAFQIETPEEEGPLVFAAEFDDGLVVYLNGVEIGRANAPGAAGEAVPASATATAPHAAGFPATFVVDPRLLRQGVNVLALQGLNYDAWSAAFRIAPVLGAGLLLPESAEAVCAAGHRLRIQGHVPVLETAFLRVGGVQAAHDPFSGEFAVETPIALGANSILVEALRADLSIAATLRLEIVGVTSLGGLDGVEARLDAGRSPYLVGRTLTVPTGHALRIDAGVELLFGDGAGLEVAGALQAAGASGRPIRFGRAAFASGWEGIRAVACRTLGLEHVELRGTAGAAIAFTDCAAQSAVVAGSLIEGAGGDGIAAETSAIFVTRTEIRNCGGNAIALRGAGASDVALCVVHHNAAGILLNDGHTATIDHVTIADNGRGIVVEGGTARAALESSVIHFNAEAWPTGTEGALSFAHCVVEADPRFANRASYELQADSPCIGAGEFGSDAGAVAAEPVPRTPSALAVAGTSAHAIVLAWNDTAINEEGFELARKGPGEADFAVIATLPADAVTAADNMQGATGEYAYKVRAFNGEGFSAWSNEARGTPGTIPWPPAELVVTGVSSQAIELVWNGGGADTFEVWRRGPEERDFSRRAVVSAPEFSDADPPLVEGGVYRYRVRAVSAAGASGWSEEVAQLTGRIPAAPGNAQSGAASPGTIVITWSDNADNELRYRVEVRRDGEAAWSSRAVLPANATAFVDARVHAEIAYGYRVQAENDVGASIWSETVAASASATSEPPRDLSVLTVGADWIQLAWRAPDMQGGEYGLWRRREGESSILIGAVRGVRGTFVDTELPAGTWYAYRLGGAGGFFSAEVSARTGAPPATPTGLRPGSPRLGAIKLSWHDVEGAESYELERRREGGAWGPVASVKGARQYIDTGLTQGVTYTYHVRAVNRFGASAWSAEAAQTSGAAPAAPVNVRVIEAGDEHLVLAWDDTSVDEIYFEVERRLTFDTQWWIVGWITPDLTVLLDTGLPHGHEFNYRVRAWNVLGPSEYSNEAYGMTKGTLRAPTDLREISWSTRAIELAWEGSGGEQQFAVSRRTGTGGSFTVVAVLPAGISRWVDRSVSPGTRYAYTVSAANQYQSSAPSAALTTAAGIAVLAVEPEFGSIEGGDEVLVKGIHLSAAAVVSFGGSVLVDPVAVEVGAISGRTPPGARVGRVEVTATDGDLTSRLAEGYDYARGLLRGDATGNNRLDIADAVLIAVYLFDGRKAPYCPALADVNGDGTPELADAINLLRYLFARGAAPSPAQVDCR